MARRSSFSVHQRLDQYSRRRRMMLSRESLSADPAHIEAALPPAQMDEQVLRRLQNSAEYLGNRSEDATKRRDLAARLMQGTASENATGSAVLADFPDVECEMLPVEFGNAASPAAEDPTSIFSEIGAASEPVPSAQNRVGKSPSRHSRKRTTGSASAPSSAADATTGPTLEASFPGKPFTATHGMNRLRAWVHDSQPRVWMFVGDETTAWMRHHGKPGYAEMFRHRLRWELHRQADLVVNAGSLHAGIVEIAQITRQGLEQCRADVVFMMPGRVDADQAARHPHLYADQLTELAEQIREQGAEPVFQTPPVPFGSGSAQAPCQLAALADVIREVSVVHQIPLIDHAEFWLEHPTAAAWSEQKTGSIRSLGHVLLALLMFSEFDIYDRRSTLCTRLQTAWQKATQARNSSSAATSDQNAAPPAQ